VAVPGVSATQITDWLKDDYGLGKGHGAAIVATLRERPASDERIAKIFSGAKARWRPTYERIISELEEAGAVGLAPTDTYISLLKGTKKFAIVAATADRLDVGIKLIGAETTARFESSGSWNSMVTHRVRIAEAANVDAELFTWLRRAYVSR